MLLPRIKRQQNNKLESFIVSNINKELAEIKYKDCHYDFIQMQYFLESSFCDKEKSVICSSSDGQKAKKML
ncbi:MAG: hypothetical protein US70_C0011G0016 [Parcubacteria group bacterium GW2011_GWD2_38_11]|nr:MAG: hypothetical protein US70_C0011G0016 [Parcubacteria group bacterium GW2011_GWD2_38_11]